MAIFGTSTPVSKLVTEAFPVFLASELRVALATLVLLPVLIKGRQNLGRYTRQDWFMMVAVAVIGMFLFSIFMLYGMQQISGVVGSIIMSTTPVVTAIGAFLFFGDRFSWRKNAAIALTVFGVLILNLGGQSSQATDSHSFWALGTLLIFGAVCSQAGYTLLGKPASRHVGPVMVSALACAIALVLFLPLALYQLYDFNPSTLTFVDWLAVGWWGMGALAGGSVFWYSGVAKASGSMAAGFMGMMPVSSLLLSYLLLGESFHWVHLTGFAAVLTGIMLIARDHHQPSSQATASPTEGP
jgi:drug/metabolite transporter (DMT)-like permease